MEEVKKKVGRPKKTEQTNVPADTEVKKVEKPRKEKLKLEDSCEIYVKSNVFGRLIYINHKTGDETVWDNEGEIQPLTVRDLRDMKAKQLSFFKENWISVIGSDDVDMDAYTVQDIYDALTVGNYYKNSVIPNDLDEVFEWSNDKMEKYIKLMPTTIRETLIIRANDKIKDGTLDSISKVKALEGIFGCELASPED